MKLGALMQLSQNVDGSFTKTNYASDKQGFHNFTPNTGEGMDEMEACVFLCLFELALKGLDPPPFRADCTRSHIKVA